MTFLPFFLSLPFTFRKCKIPVRFPAAMACAAIKGTCSRLRVLSQNTPLRCSDDNVWRKRTISRVGGKQITFLQMPPTGSVQLAVKSSSSSATSEGRATIDVLLNARCQQIFSIQPKWNIHDWHKTADVSSPLTFILPLHTLLTTTTAKTTLQLTLEPEHMTSKQDSTQAKVWILYKVLLHLCTEVSCIWCDRETFLGRLAT